MDDSCEGCYSYPICFLRKRIILFNIKMKCPCEDCLVKGMCSDTCEPFKNAFKVMRKYTSTGGK